MVLVMGSMIHYRMSKRNLHSNTGNDVFEVIEAHSSLISSLYIFKKYIITFLKSELNSTYINYKISSLY